MLKEEALPPPVMCGKTLPTHNPKVITNRSPQSTNSVISTYSFLRKISNESGFVQQLCNMAVNKSAVEIANEFTSFHTTLQKLDAKIIKRELLANFAYPLFCHTYVTCLGKNEQIAGEFWAKYSDKLKNQTGVPCSICDKLTNFKFLQQSSVQDQASLISELNALANVKIVRTISEQASEQLTKVLATNDFQFISSLFLNKLQVNISNVETEILQTSSPDGFEIEQFLQSPFETDETKVKIEPSCENDLGESATKSEEQTITDGERSHTYVATHLLSTNFTNVLCSDLSGNYLATGNLDNAIRTIDLVHSQMQNIHPIPLESISLQNFANSLPEDEELEQIFAENRKRIDKLKSLNVLYGHHKPVFSLKFSNTWPYLLSCGGDGDCRLWDLTTNKSVVNYSGHNFSLYAVSVSNNDSYFASGGQDMTCRFDGFLSQLKLKNRTFTCKIIQKLYLEKAEMCANSLMCVNGENCLLLILSVRRFDFSSSRGS